MRPSRLRAAVGCLLVAGAAPTSRPVDPAYKLTAGQTLTYADHSVIDQNEIHVTWDRTAAYRVVGRSADGVGYHLIRTVTENDRDPPLLAAMDLWPDGRTAIDPNDQAQADPADHFPPLPPTATTDHWTRPTDDHTEVYRRAPATRPATLALAADWHLQGSMPTGSLRIAGDRLQTFDLNQGLIVHASSRRTTDMGSQHARVAVTSDLVAVRSSSPEETARYTAQATAYMTAAAIQARMLAAADRAADPPAAIARAAEPLEALRRTGRITDPELAKTLDRAIDADLRRAALRAGLVNRPAPAWDLPDLAGHRHTLAEQHGKVVVLDFWFRGCPPCLAAMPELRRLAEAYAGRPVAFFGMNIDRDPNDAKAVADRFGLPYPTLRLAAAGDPTLAMDYQVAGYPTLFVIGPDGVVRHVHVGSGPTLHDDLAREVDTLLSTTAPRSRNR